MIIFRKIEKLLVYKIRQQMIVDAILMGKKDCRVGQNEINKLRDKISKLESR